jgi:hypothetical protein
MRHHAQQVGHGAGIAVSPGRRPVSSIGALWWSWWRAVTLAETLGFAVPATVGATLSAAPDSVLAAAMVAAGFVEGAALGAGEYLVLRRALPGLAARSFVTATALAAAFAYAVAMVPVLLAVDPSLMPWWAVILVFGGLGALLLASIGTAQWLVLRRLAAQVIWWIPATAAAWAVGLLAFLAVATPLWQDGEAPLIVLAIGVLGGLAMAAVVAALTGWAAVRLVGRAHVA